MNSWFGRAFVLMVVGFGCGCGGIKGKPFDPSFINSQRYLCCNMRFDQENVARDANYTTYRNTETAYGVPSQMLAAGTPVKIVKVGAAGVVFIPEGKSSPYKLEFRYGAKVMTPQQYFSKILLTDDPRGALKNVPPSVANGFRDGKLVVGMTREQALIARGYPPAHRTPSLENNEWTYYDTLGFVDHVVFVKGKIDSITRGPAPQ